jgi:hypothetical protein
MGIKFNILPFKFATRLAVQIYPLGGIEIIYTPPPTKLFFLAPAQKKRVIFIVA